MAFEHRHDFGHHSTMPDNASYANAWRQIAPHGLRAVARDLALPGVAGLWRMTGQMSTLLHRPRVQVVLLHHVFPDEENQLRELLTLLKRDHTFIGYSDAMQRAEASGVQFDRPYVTITFDDGFKNCVRASAILAEFDARACFFVCPSMIGETNDEKINSFCRDRLKLPRPVQFMSWDDLEKLCDAGNEIGGHTMTHPNLAQLSQSQAEDEIRGSFEAIKRRLGEVKHFAWTYGQFSDCNAQIVKTVYECGFTSCASGVRGCHGPQRSDRSLPLCVRRDHLVAGWPLSAAKYFLAQSSRRLSATNGEWPTAWRSIIAGR